MATRSALLLVLEQPVRARAPSETCGTMLLTIMDMLSMLLRLVETLPQASLTRCGPVPRPNLSDSRAQGGPWRAGSWGGNPRSGPPPRCALPQAEDGAVFLSSLIQLVPKAQLLGVNLRHRTLAIHCMHSIARITTVDAPAVQVGRLL